MIYLLKCHIVTLRIMHYSQGKKKVLYHALIRVGYWGEKY